MAWNDNLRPASFRGVKFFVDVAEFSTGRRMIHHEFPDRDTPFAEDLGKKAESFSLECHILGDDYFAQRDSFLAALTTAGPGELIHPYLGSKNVQVGNISLKEDTKQGRIAFFTVAFFEAGEALFPAASEDKISSLLASADVASVAAGSDFKSAYDILGLPAAGIAKARGALKKVTDAMNKATAPLDATDSYVAGIRRDIAKFQRDIDKIIARPDEIQSRISSIMKKLGLAGGKTNRIQSVKATKTLVGYNRTAKPPATPLTPQTKQAEKNVEAVTQIVQREAIIETAKNEAQLPFPSVNDAVVAREEMTTEIEAITAETTNDDVYQAFEDLKAIIVRTLPDDQATLPIIKEVTPQRTTPSLVLAYDLYEDKDKEQDIIDRNKIKHPGFIPGQSPLEVLSA